MHQLALCPPVQVMFPAAHVTQRMEQTAAGLWPERGPAVEDTDTVPNTLLKVSTSGHCFHTSYHVGLGPLGSHLWTDSSW